MSLAITLFWYYISDLYYNQCSKWVGAHGSSAPIGQITLGAFHMSVPPVKTVLRRWEFQLRLLGKGQYISSVSLYRK